MYAVEQPARPGESWAELGAITDAVARGDAERARSLTALHAERSFSAHRLRRPRRGEDFATCRTHGERPRLTARPYTKKARRDTEFTLPEIGREIGREYGP